MMRIPRPSAAACGRAAALVAIAVPLVALLIWSLGAARGLGREPQRVTWLAPLLLPSIASAAPPAATLSALAAAPEEGWYGIGLRCSDCSMSRDDSTGARVWQFRSAPEIRWIDPDSPADKAGVEQGDKIVKVSGLPITSPEAGRRFGSAKPGEKIQWTVERDGKEQTLTLVATERPESDKNEAEMRRQLHDAHQQLEEARSRLLAQLHEMDENRSGVGRRSLEEAERQLEQTHREIERMMRENRTPRAWDSDGVLAVPALPRLPAPPDAPDAPGAPAAPSRRQHMRYETNVGEWHVEVRSSGDVGVSESNDHSEIIIKTPDSTIRVRKNH
jgi:hypothetical protein